MQVDPLKSIEFQREFCANAIEKGNATKMSEFHQIQKKDLELTPADIGRAQRRVRVSKSSENLLSRFIDTFA